MDACYFVWKDPFNIEIVMQHGKRQSTVEISLRHDRAAVTSIDENGAVSSSTGSALEWYPLAKIRQFVMANQPLFASAPTVAAETESGVG